MLEGKLKEMSRMKHENSILVMRNEELQNGLRKENDDLQKYALQIEADKKNLSELKLKMSQEVSQYEMLLLGKDDVD
jgi:hypothetical protein